MCKILCKIIDVRNEPQRICTAPLLGKYGMMIKPDIGHYNPVCKISHITTSRDLILCIFSYSRCRVVCKTISSCILQNNPIFDGLFTTYIIARGKRHEWYILEIENGMWHILSKLSAKGRFSGHSGVDFKIAVKYSLFIEYFDFVLADQETLLEMSMDTPHYLAALRSLLGFYNTFLHLL